jgi:putative endonuclease
MGSFNRRGGNGPGPRAGADGSAILDGETFEARSADLLESYGYRIVGRRYRTRMGEIDLIASDGEQLLFVEVRARRHSSHGGAAASVDRRKQCKLTRCATHFLSRNPQWRHLPCRFDVIAWDLHPEGYAEAQWIAAAFTA